MTRRLTISRRARRGAHLLSKLQTVSETVLSDSVPGNPADRAAGFRHLLVLLWIGIDDTLRRDSSPMLAIRPSNTDAVFKWGMDCPDCIYTGSGFAGATRTASGEPGYGSLRRSADDGGHGEHRNVLLDANEMDLAERRLRDRPLRRRASGNWMKIADDATQLVVRHFFYDWTTEVASSLSIERLCGPAHKPPATREPIDPRAVVARQLVALGDFVEANLDFFLQFARPESESFNPPFDGTAMGAAAENRPVMGSFQIAPDEALIVEVEPPKGLYWSYSIGNPWWETIDYARHQSSLNGHQAVIDDDGVLRVVIAHSDPGLANWLDTAGHSEGPVILRCVRTEMPTVPTTRVVKMADVITSVPAGARRISAQERTAVMDARKLAVSRRFTR